MNNLLYLCFISIFVAFIMKQGLKIKFKNTFLRFIYIVSIGVLIYAPYYQLFASGEFNFLFLKLTFENHPWVSFASLGYMFFISKYLPVK
ncbi:hypothetical protein AKH13_22245 [Vibrio parahaemolyticus]|nr:hypothetical protein [Vibrio parahaemolyticus]OCP86419.1 hypothetical protein AKH13_22245 [Vibrio parahaemolyticus]OCP93412.1 hypothetical protein AKH14_24000 [Vibrio parahaemolyticus]